MDEMDRLLSQLPYERHPEDLPERIFLAIRARKRRNQQRLVLSGIMALIGIWLVTPALLSFLDTLEFPASGLLIMTRAVQNLAANLEASLVLAFLNFSAFQQSITESLGFFTILGLSVLGVGVLLALDQLLTGWQRL